MTQSTMNVFRTATNNLSSDDFGKELLKIAESCVKAQTRKFSFITVSDVEDLYMKVIQKAWEARESYDSTWSLYTWVNTIAWRTIDDWYSKWTNNGGITDSIDDSFSVDESDDCSESGCEDYRCFNGNPQLYEEFRADRELLTEEEKATFKEAVKTLSEQDQKLSAMLLDGMDAEMIAWRLGITENNVYGRVFKLRKRLKQKLSNAA